MNRSAFVLYLCAMALAACSGLTGVPQDTRVPSPAAWLHRDGLVETPGDWWTQFGDPVLTALVTEGLRENLDLRQADGRVAEAQAVWRAQRGAAWPTVTAGAGVTRSRQISEVFGQPYDSTGEQALVQVSFDVDLWGRIQSLKGSTGATFEAARASRSAVELTIASAIASTYIALRAADARLALDRQTLESRQHSLAVNKTRLREGFGTALDVSQAELELQTTAQSISLDLLSAQRLERTLDVLLGRLPGTIERGRDLHDLNLPGVPSAGVPSKLVQRRPDVAVAEWGLVAADRQFAAARAQLLPSVRLGASLGDVKSSVLHGDPFTVWSLGASVLAPIFNGGQLRAQSEASGARRDQALEAYRKVVLTSFSEVELQLGSHALQMDQLAAADAVRVAAAQTLRLAERRRKEGYASRLDELLAQRSLFSAEQVVLQARADLLITDVNLFKALGGGWRQDGRTSDQPPNQQ